MLSVIMLNVILLNVVMLSVAILSVVMLNVVVPKKALFSVLISPTTHFEQIGTSNFGFVIFPEFKTPFKNLILLFSILNLHSELLIFNVAVTYF